MNVFGMRVAPGVRLSASHRGLRAHVGPRQARLHVGGGGTGVSTGAGPITYYQTLTGGRRRRTLRPETSGSASTKAQMAAEIEAYLWAMSTLHHAGYAPLTRPVAPMPPVPDLATLTVQIREQRLAEVRWWDLPGRSRAKQQARQDAARRHADLVADAQVAQSQQQETLDGDWNRYVAGEADVVLDVVNGAFEDNLAPAAAVGLEDGEVQVAVLVPGFEAVPARMPGVTDAGNVSLRQMNKTQTAEIHRTLVAGHVLATVKEALVVAPDASGVAIVALRDDGPDVYGEDRARPVLAARFGREDLAGVLWQQAEAWDIVEQASDDLRVDLDGRTGALELLNLTDEPELAALTHAVEWE